MKLIKLKKLDKTVTVIIEINSINLWHYVYRISSNNNFTNSPDEGKSNNHDLGIVKNLDKKRHDWVVRLGNITNINKKIPIKITWKEDGKEIAEWIPGEADDDGRVLVKANSAVEITDSSLFIKT